MAYGLNENGVYDFKSFLKDATSCENIVADYFRIKGYTVQNVGSDKKTDLVISKNGLTKTIEVKHNLKQKDRLWLESISVLKFGKLVEGWMITNTSDYIIFVCPNYTEMLITNFSKLKAAYINLVPDSHEIEQANTGYISKSYVMYLNDLEKHGASFTRIKL